MGDNEEKALKAELDDISDKIREIYKNFSIQALDEELYAKLKMLGDWKREILRIEEISWKLKSRALWLKEGDQNTKFFHKCAFDRKNKNAIWRIRRADGFDAITNLDI